MSAEKRREIAERVLKKARVLGLPIEQDPRFSSWLEQWVSGELEMQEVRRLYQGLLNEQSSQGRRNW